MSAQEGDHCHHRPSVAVLHQHHVAPNTIPKLTLARVRSKDLWVRTRYFQSRVGHVHVLCTLQKGGSLRCQAQANIQHPLLQRSTILPIELLRPQQPATCHSMEALPIPQRKREEGFLQQSQDHHHGPLHHQMHRLAQVRRLIVDCRQN